MAPWPIQLGAEFVHGANSAFTRVTKDFNIQVRQALHSILRCVTGRCREMPALREAMTLIALCFFSNIRGQGMEHSGGEGAGAQDATARCPAVPTGRESIARPAFLRYLKHSHNVGVGLHCCKVLMRFCADVADAAELLTIAVPRAPVARLVVPGRREPAVPRQNHGSGDQEGE